MDNRELYYDDGNRTTSRSRSREVNDEEPKGHAVDRISEPNDRFILHQRRKLLMSSNIDLDKGDIC